MLRPAPILLLVAWVGTLAMSCSSAPRTHQGRTIVVRGTPEFEAKAASLKLSPIEASTALLEYRFRTETVPLSMRPTTEQVLNGLDMIIDNSYVFVNTSSKHRVSLSGYYIDGMTGKVDSRIDSLSLNEARALG